jgi:replicative DNA helicase
VVTAAKHLPPQNVDAEMSALGAMMRGGGGLEAVLEGCKVDDFYHSTHRTIFDAIASLTDRSEPVDLITVQEELRRAGKLEECGGTEYLVQLVESVPGVANASYYAEIVRRNSMLRSLLGAAEEVLELVRSDEEFDAIFEQAEHKIFSAGERRIQRFFHPVKDLITTYFEQVQDAFDTGKHQMGVPTGFADLDAITSGLYPSDLTIIAARPSVGKTALALHTAMNVATRQKLTVAFFSLEMSATQLVQRMVCSTAPVNSQRTRTVSLRDEDFERIHTAADKLFTIPMYIDDSSDLTTLEVAAKCRRLKSQYGLGLVVVDYLQLMRGGKRAENRTQEISEIARGLKRIAKDLDVPVIALSQLSRSVEQRESKRPLLSDLRESGSIEAEADLVLLLYREGYYKQQGRRDGEEGDEEEEAMVDGVPTEKVEIIVAKHRNGPTGSVFLAFQPEFARFLSYERGGR